MWATIGGNETQRADACHHFEELPPLLHPIRRIQLGAVHTEHINDDDVSIDASTAHHGFLQLYILPPSRLLGLSKANSVVAKIVNAIPSTQEGVAEDGQGAYWLWEVHSHEAADARALNLKDVVIRTNGEVIAGKSEAHIGQGVALVTFNSVLSVEALFGTDLLVEQLGNGGWE